ncbi:zinc-binding dehydrogenase [Microbacterium gorillae]|uniref:zinc-binding dehydrogenase n=1 Tax=Microbacterium gorillae TaxID=1231063 RepID=UPI000AB4DA33|nr:zinc-binding dehydrogenase [Microbacterium gorillae]
MRDTLQRSGSAHAFDVCLRPPATARVWIGPDHPHETIAVPGITLSAGEALVRVELATVCGSDVHTVAGDRPAPVPLVLGHEYVGRIISLGAGVVRTVDGSPLSVGDRVVWSVFAACRECDRCRRGLPQKCRDLRKYGHERIGAGWELTGGFATHVHLRAGTAIVRAPEHLAAAVLAPAACGTATAHAAVEALDDLLDLDGAVVLVSGAGLIGLTVTAMADDRGARVIVSDPAPDRRATAREFGATVVVDPSDPDALSTALTALRATEVHAVVEASGARRAVLGALDAVAVGGAIALVGSVFATTPIELDPEHVVRACLTIRGVHNYAPTDLDGAVRFLQRTRRPFADLVSAPVPLSRIDEAIARAGAAGAPVRVAVDPGS